MISRDKLRVDINNLSRSLVSSNHCGQADIIINRIYMRCQEYFDRTTLDSLEAMEDMKVMDMEHKERTANEVHQNFGGDE